MDFQADLANLAQMMVYIRMQATSSGMTEKALNKIELACEEAIVNIISYGYPEKKGKLSIDCQKVKSRFEIILRDQGHPFNPMGVEHNPQVDQPIQERRIGGLGIFLLRKTIDEASYQRTPSGENMLRLLFRIE